MSSCNNDDLPVTVEDVKTAECVNGRAGNYPCNGYDLKYRMSLTELGFKGATGNDCWGWVDPSNNNEYAIIGTTAGTSFVNITDPENPVLVGKLPTQTFSSPWRDLKVYKNHVFIVADRSSRSNINEHGIQIFDLTKLKDVTNPPQTFSADKVFDEITSAHNIVINEEMGYAYVTGTLRDDKYRGGITFVNISNPENPEGAGGYADDGYSHDGQVVTYTGPDTDYTGKEIFIGSNENEVTIVDVTYKAAPKRISKLSYPNFRYAHQGWFTEDQKYFLLGDELDEGSLGFNTRTIIFDLTDLDDPKVHTEYLGPTSAIDHNGYVKGNSFFQASYTAGFREIDISEIENKNLNEVAFFDTYPETNSAKFNGAWSVYPYFPSGNIIISDIDRGLFIISRKK